MCYSFRYKHRIKKNVSYGHLCANQFKIKIKSQLPPLPPSLTVVRARGRGGWDLNLTWLEWSDIDEMIFLKNLVLFSYKRRLSSDKPPGLNDSHFTNRNGKVRDRSQTVITFFTAMLVLLKNKPFSAGTDVTASCVHTFILASTVVILTFVFVLGEKRKTLILLFEKKSINLKDSHGIQQRGLQ